MPKSKIFVVIPAYNEGRSIVRVIRDLKSHAYNNIVIVDDCSKDRTFETAKRAGVTVLKHLVNRGQGAALKTGIDFVLEQGADIIVTFDADGQHLAMDIPLLVKPILDKKVDVTLGSRFLGGKSNVPFAKKILLKGGVIFTWLFSGIKLTDTHNGLRALSRRAAQKINITQDRMEHASEIIDQIHKKRIKFKEVPVNIRYTEYSKKKGQRITNSIRIMFNLIMRKLTR
ncbi:glycosyltransferase family 2 protein [Candidatus Woesearchaeota archaeon]|nr:glycosyltransferase family 2 protein [Candidatus Woesearchaeota archaeon]